jgi:alpha-glucosidase
MVSLEGMPSIDDAWWRDAVIYQVYPRSFADSDGDGMGDLPGITSHLGDLRDLGVDAVWLSPFYPSPQHDAGYDVSDYRNVDPRFGSLDDADKLIARAHAEGLKVIVDLVPNHTSSEHAWFQEALRAAPGSDARERYIFRDGKGPGGDQPPNSWQSTFGGPAWERVTEPDGTPGQWYLHLFDVTQPDLNWSNPEVRAEFVSVLRFWLDRGVDGFRVDVAHGLVKEQDLSDWTQAPKVLGGLEIGPPPPMWDQDGVHEIYQQWRAVLDTYPGGRILVAEAWVTPAERLARYVRPDEMHQAFNFLYLDAPWSADPLRKVIDESLAANDAVGATTTWVLSNHDVVRHTSRLGYPVGHSRMHGIGAGDPQPDPALGLRRARAATLQMLALPGSAYLYQGEELGLPEHTLLPDDRRQDPAWFRSGRTERGRDGCRVPIPWGGDSAPYGFGPGDAQPWIPQPDVFKGLSVEAQTGVEGSTLEFYRATLAARRAHALPQGDEVTVLEGTGELLELHRGGLRVLLNCGTTDLPLPEGTVVASSAPVTDVLPPDTCVWLG